MSKGVQIAGAATLIALLLGWYAVTNLEDTAAYVYYQSLDEFRSSDSARSGDRARVHGYVAIGSIERDLAARQVRFTVQPRPPHAGGPAGERMAVIYSSLEIPDLFKEGAEVVIEGRLASDPQPGTFHADRVLAKCPSKFEAQLDAPPASL